MADKDITVDGNLTNVTSPSANDRFLIVDNAATALKDITWTVIRGAIWDYLTSLTAKTTLTGADQFSIADSAASNVAKKITWTNLLAEIVSQFTAASTTVAGKVELTTTAEINTGTDSTRAMPVDQFVASNRNVRYALIRVVGATTDWSADGSTTVGGDVELPFTGTITEIGAFSDTPGTTGTAIVDVNLNGSTIMTTNKLKWDSGEKSTRTYSGTAPGLTTTAVTAGDILTVDIDTNHTTKSKGLTIRLGIRQT